MKTRKSRTKTRKADRPGEAFSKATDKLERAEDLVIEQARFIAKYICNAHICVQMEPAIALLVERTRKLNKASDKFHQLAGL